MFSLVNIGGSFIGNLGLNIIVIFRKIRFISRRDIWIDYYGKFGELVRDWNRKFGEIVLEVWI